ncbi:metal ABC transporter solute-binding protein, Zn/Mn family [Skermania piniformis]|uniref:Zinc ABC transporter substrate-binding protein n=1 Tax=Skermania pinensis TaxID=39122 RepID=A0ABX8S700_9ACTN|nr:zinc ABC transporter substrate-binding protein [Skermania piniformis]QXQ13615.1 zinc ABC transporter substrate-binding protein [Skermania piniformis]
MTGATARPAVTLVAATLVALTLGGCGSGEPESDRLDVVTTTDVWAGVAAAVGGSGVQVRSIISDPTADPHSFEPTPADAATVADAALVVYNGGDYDPFVPTILAAENDPARQVVNAFELRHDRADTNEHVWYDPATVAAVADAIATELGRLDPSRRDYYADRATDFDRQLDTVRAVTDRIAREHPGAPVAQTEPVSHYLLVAAKVDDRTPAEFENAIETETDPPPAALAAVQDLLSQKQVRALIDNTQTTDSRTRSLRDTATRAGVRVVEVSETLPAGTEFIDWQVRTAQALADALR